MLPLGVDGRIPVSFRYGLLRWEKRNASSQAESVIHGMTRFKAPDHRGGKARMDFMLTLGSCLEIIVSRKLTEQPELAKKGLEASVNKKTLVDSI